MSSTTIRLSWRTIFPLLYLFLSNVTSDTFVNFPNQGHDILVPASDAKGDAFKVCSNPGGTRIITQCSRNWPFIHETFRKCVSPHQPDEQLWAAYVCRHPVLMLNCILTNTPHDSQAKLNNIQNFHQCMGVFVPMNIINTFSGNADDFKQAHSRMG